MNLLTVFWFLFEWKTEKKSFHKIYICDKQNKVLEQQIADSQSTLCVTSATPSHETYNFNNLLILFPTKNKKSKKKNSTQTVEYYYIFLSFIHHPLHPLEYKLTFILTMARAS